MADSVPTAVPPGVNPTISPPSTSTLNLPKTPLSDQLIERCVALSSWGHGITNAGRECKTRKERRARLTLYTHLESRVTHDSNVIVPHESTVSSKPVSRAAPLSDEDFVKTDAYKNCTATPRTFTPSIRSAGEICNAIAHSQYNSFHMYNTRKMSPAFMTSCSAFGGRREKKTALLRCFSDKDRVDALIKDFECLGNNAYEGFVRALEEKSPVNAALAAWACGRAAVDTILLKKNKLKHGSLKKYDLEGMFSNDGTVSYTSPDVYVSEIGKRSKNVDMTFDTATRIFDNSIKRILSAFVNEASGKGTKTLDLALYLRQTRMGTDIGSIYCPGMLSPRDGSTLKSEQEKMSKKPEYTKMATLFDDEVNEVGKKRKRNEAEDFEQTMASNIIGAKGVSNQAEWSMHITQLVSQAFLETMSSLLACSFGVADPLSKAGLESIKKVLLKNEGDNKSKRVEESAATAAVEYFVKAGNFTIPFVASDPYDVIEGMRVSPNTPVIFIVNKSTDPNDNTKTVTTFSLRDRLLVKDDFMKKALASKTNDEAASYITLTEPTVGGSLPVIRGPLSTDVALSTSVKEAKEGISLDWYVHMTNMCTAGKTSAAVASGISRALASVDAKKSSRKPDERDLLKALRRNVDRSKNLLCSMGQNLSSWSHEEHNATVNSYWSSISAVKSFALQEALNRGGDVGVRHQFDKGCDRDSFTNAEANLRAAFFDAVDRPGDSILHLGDVLASFSSKSADASWRKFVDAMGSLPGASRRVFNVKELLSAASGFKSAFGANRRRKDVLKNVGAAVKLIKGLVDMTLQRAFNTSRLIEAGSVADGWTFNNQFEPSRMKALEDLASSRNRNDVVTLLLSKERGSTSFADRKRSRRTDVLVILLVILEHLVADKVVLDSICSTGGRTLADHLENFIDILSGTDTKTTFNNQYRFMTLVRYIWFNVAILSLTDSNVISAIDMARRDLGASIYSDYLAILRLINKYGQEASRYSIGKIAKAYIDDKKKKNGGGSSCSDSNKITTNDALNSVLKKLTVATEAFSGDTEASTKGVQALKDEATVNDAVITVDHSEVIGVDGKKKVDDLLTFLKFVVESSMNLGLVTSQASIYNLIPDQTQLVIRQLGISGPSINKALSQSKQVTVNLNSALKQPMMDGITRLIARLTNKETDNATVIATLRDYLVKLKAGDCKRLIANYSIPAGVTPKAAVSIIAALNEQYPHLDLLSKALDEFIAIFKPTAATQTSLSVKMRDLKTFLKSGLVVSLACLTNPRGVDFNVSGADLLAKIVAHFSAEASLAISRLQKTFSPIHPGLLALHDTIKPTKADFEAMTEDFVKSVIEKIEEGAAPIVSHCDDSRVTKGLSEAGRNYNDSFSSSANVLSEHIKNPMDVWNKYSLAHFDTAIVPKFANTSRLSNADIVKLSAYWQGMSTLPVAAKPAEWSTELVGVSNDFSVIPGMSNVCTFNSALDTLLANPENSCGLISREITRNSARLAHDISSEASLKTIDDILNKGTVAVMPRRVTHYEEEEEQHYDVFKPMSSSASGAAITSALSIVSDRFCNQHHQTSASTDNDLVYATVRAFPAFRQNIIGATRSLFESAAVCNLLSDNAAAKVASKKIISMIKSTSPFIDEIGISRIAGLVGSITTYKQYKNFLTFVDERRKHLMRRATLNYNSTCNGNANDSVYIGLASMTPSVSGKIRHMPDRFWINLFEECDGFLGESASADRVVYSSKLNSYAAVATGVDRETNKSLKADIEARRDLIKTKMGDIEEFVIAAAKTDLYDDSNVALSSLLKAQRLYSRMTAAAEARKNDSVIFMSNQGRVPFGANIIDGVFSEIASGKEGENAGNLFLSSKLLVAKELVRHSSTPEAIEFVLASAGVSTYAYKLAELICQRMKADDISLFLGGTMFQRGLFTTFLINDILVRQISPDLKTDTITDDTKTQLVNLVEFCSKIKRALITMRNNKGRTIRRYNNAKTNNKTVTDDMRADWAFASSVFSAFSALRDKTSHETRTSNILDMLNSGSTSPAFGGVVKRKSTLNDLLTAGSTLDRSFLSTYCEKAAANKIVRSANIRMYRTLKLRQNESPSLLACFDSGRLLSGSVEEGMRDNGMVRYCQDEDYNMLLDEYDEDVMDVSSESSSSSEDDDFSDWTSSSDEDDESDDDSVSRRRDALDTLDSLAVPLGKLYACGEGDEDYGSTFDTNLKRMIGRIVSDDDESDEEGGVRSGGRHAQRIVYGAGFLSGGPNPIYDNSSKLGKFLRGKKTRYDDDDYLYSTSSSDDTTGPGPVTGRLKRRSKSEQLSFMKRGLRQFVPKDITIDSDDNITLVEYMSDEKVPEFLGLYSSSNTKERKELREKYGIINSANVSKGTRTERAGFRRALVKSAAVIVKTLKENGDLIYSALFAPAAAAAINVDNVAEKLLFKDKLSEIVETRNTFIKQASAAASTLFSCEDKPSHSTSSSAEKGYLSAPLEKLALCLRKEAGSDETMSVKDVFEDKTKTHLDWLNTVAAVFARSYNVATGYALDETLKVSTVLNSLYDSFKKVVKSTDGTKEDVKSTLLSDIFNTRMVHTNAILGLFYPVAFLNHQIVGKDQLETNKIEMEVLTLVRGVNSRQFCSTDLSGGTDILLNRLMSSRVAGPAGTRGGLSLFRMSLTDTILGKSGVSEGGRVKGAVSLEVRDGGALGGVTIDNSVFAKKCKDLVKFCQDQDILVGNASGPLYRFATGVKDIKKELSLPFSPAEGDVSEDVLVNRLIANESDEKRGDFMRLSAYGNLYGCSDIVSRLARKSIETKKAVELLLDDSMKAKTTKERAKAILDDLKARCVKSLKTPFNKKSIIQANNGFPSFSDNVLLKSREFMASVTTLTPEVSKRLSLEFNKLSLKSFERILENSAVLANTKTTLRNLENRLQAAVVELRQFKHIRDEGLATSRKVIANIANKLCTMEHDDDDEWLDDDTFIKFVVDSELLNLKEAKRNISSALRGVHAQHVALLDMINSAISTDEDYSSQKQQSTAAASKMRVSACGKYVVHPTTGLLVKIEEGDDIRSCGDGIEAIHRQVALKVLGRIDRNRNSMLRARLYSMRTGRGDLRDIMSFDNEDVVKADALVKVLGTALANSSSASPSSPQQQQQQSAVTAFSNSVLPIRKVISYIPVAAENRHTSPPTSPLNNNRTNSRRSILSDGNSETTYRFLDQQEAHDLSSIINIHTKHRMGEYNQASVVSLFNRSQKARATVSFDDNKEASPSKQLFDNISQNTSSPQSSVPSSSTPPKRISEYVSKLASSLSDTPEYNELSGIYDDMASALNSANNLSGRQFITNPGQEGHHPKADYDTITAISEMKQLKTTAIERFIKLLSGLENFSNDPSLATSTRHNSSPIVSTIKNGALDSSIVSGGSTSVYGRIEASFEGGNPKEAMNRETDIRITLLMHYEPFLKKMQRVLKMITDYFKNIENVHGAIKSEVERVTSDQIKKIETALNISEQDAVPVYRRGVDMHKEEINAINTEISVIGTKLSEIDDIHRLYAENLENANNKLNTGSNELLVYDLMLVSDTAQQQTRTIEDLKSFAKNHSGIVYDASREDDGDSDNMKTIKNEIERGQESVKVSYDKVLVNFPLALQGGLQSKEDKQLFLSILRKTMTSLGEYAIILKSRKTLLEERAAASSEDAKSIEERIGNSKFLLQTSFAEQKDMLDKCVSVAISAVNHALSGEVVQVDTLDFIEIRVDSLLLNAKRGDTPATVNEASDGEAAATTFNATNEVENLVAEVEGTAFACQLKPLHDSIDRMMGMYRRKGTSIVSSKVDLQLSTVFDMSMSVLGKNARPEQKPSAIVPGLCKLCSMMITNLHEVTHTSDHAFEFDKVRSAETLRRMLSAVISKDSDKANVRYDTLSLLESNNGFIKDLKFKKKQKVACMTPVNSLLGAYDSMTVQPGTVILPTSELFDCDGLDHDKFRSTVHRMVDPALADSSKSADSIVETLAGSDPNAEMLFYTYKDERRYFNSIPDCIIENMSENASSIYNTHCSQSTVKEDENTGIPVFVGRLNRSKYAPSPAANRSPANGGVPVHCTTQVNMGSDFMVAPGSTLNAKKEEMMRLSRISDINNAKYCDLDVNVSGSNNAWRIGEIVKAACGGNDMLMEKAKKMLLLGSVTSLAQQKASTRNNDPSTLLQTNSVVDQYITGEAMSADDLITKMSYQQRFFPEICNHNNRFVGSVAASTSGEVCPGYLLGDYKRFRKALNQTHDNGCGVFLNSVSGVPTSSTQQGILDTVVQSQPLRERAALAVEAMTDSTVDMVTAVSSGAWKNANLLIPHTAIIGKPVSKERADDLKYALSNVIDNASKLERGLGGLSSLNAILGGGGNDGKFGFASQASIAATGSTESERLFNVIMGSSHPSTYNTQEEAANNRSLVSSILDVSEREMSDMVRTLEDSIEKKRLEQAINDIKKNILTTSSSTSTSRASPALSSILKASDVRQGRLSASIMESGEDAVAAIDRFKTTPLLVRHTALFHPHTPLTLSRQTKGMLARRTKSTTTANNILSEAMPILSDVVLCNTRDTPAERAIDRMLLSTFIVKQGKHFDDVCSTLPVALTSATHNMLSAIDSRTSRLLSNLKLHVNDTTSIFKNVERFEKLTGRYGDEYAMSNRQNCNCPFELHHDFRPSADESLVRSFAYARPEVTQDEIRDTPYRCNRMLADKHYIMAASKVDSRISGAALYRRVSEWADMHSSVSYTGAFEPSRNALSNSNFATAGVNLDVIVRPNNVSGVLGVLGCHRKHLCIADLKTSVASSLPSVFIDCDKEAMASELIQNALPHNRYIQKSRINSASIIFSNILDKTIKDLGLDISKDLSYKLINGEHSVSESVLEETNSIMNKLMDSVAMSGGIKASSSPGGDENSASADLGSASAAATTANDIAINYTRNAIREAVSAELKGAADNVPFSSAVDGSVAFDFLMSKDSSSSSSSLSDKSMIAIVFESIANNIGDKDFGRILDEIDAKIKDHTTADALSNMSNESREKWIIGQQELRRLLSFMRILRDNITPSLSTGELGEKMKLYISLISAKSRYENTLRYGLSNSSSVDLSHLKPLNPTAVSKNIEDTFTYRNVPPVFVMALPDNFSALFQQEQRDPNYIIDNRRSLTSFLNHPNTKTMANAARASVGAGGGNTMGIYPSSLLLQESTVSTAEPVVDTKTSPPTIYETTVTKSPLMIVDPFKDSAGLENIPASAGDIMVGGGGGGGNLTLCSYLQVSMPTQFSGLVTNTGYTPSSSAKFEFKRRDGSVAKYKKIVPSVLCSDASFNLLDEFSRADTTLDDMEIRFGFMPEILEAIAKFKGLEVSDVIKNMKNANSNGGLGTSTVDRATGDIIVQKSGVAFPSYAVDNSASTAPSSTWGGTDGLLQGRLLPAFLFYNPGGAATVNGIPITREGEFLAAMKREKASGIGEGGDEEFGKGMLSYGALRAVGDKALSSDLKPLKEGWDRIIKLQKVFSTTAVNLRESIKNKTVSVNDSATGIAKSLLNNFKTLNECKNFIRDMAARIVASSDLITGGYGGDPTRAFIAPYRAENMGIIGAVSSSGHMGIGGLIASKSRGIEALRTAMEEQITLSSKQGREMPEHGGIRYDTGEELISDADSLFRGLVKQPPTTSLLHRVVENIVQGLDSGDRMRRRARVDVMPSINSEENKRHAITKLLSENHTLLTAIANTMYFGGGEGSTSRGNNNNFDVTGDVKYQQRMMYDGANKDGMNSLFNTK